MEHLISKLDDSDWLSAANELYFILKSKLQGPRGAIKSVRELYEKQRRNQLSVLKEDFIYNKDLSNIDARLDSYTSQMYSINSLPQTKIYYDFLNTINESEDLSILHPECQEIAKLVLGASERNQTTISRLNSIVSRVVTESLGQSNKANAGLAGEDLVLTLFEMIGLKNGRDFKHQHKSNSGSDTDFVLPYVKDFADQHVEIFMAVQFSSNDRTRLISSELKTGAQQYFVTGNGFHASTKSLSDIGVQILEDAKSKNYLMVCFAPEIEREKSSLLAKISDGVNIAENKDRLDYMTNYTVTFTELALKLMKRIDP
jgi:hypothetical protein